MENIIIKDAIVHVSGTAFYLDLNTTFSMKGTKYCNITEIVLFF